MTNEVLYCIIRYSVSIEVVPKTHFSVDFAFGEQKKYFVHSENEM